eukprot:1645445-Prorocentrum_lima.AAC.1
MHSRILELVFRSFANPPKSHPERGPQCLTRQARVARAASQAINSILLPLMLCGFAGPWLRISG